MNERKVLIIEDDAVVATALGKQLQKAGYTLDVARDGQDGFFRLHAVRPDAVLLDLILPKMSGLAWLKDIRALPEFQKLPVIVLTSAYLPAMVQMALEAGATLVCNKSTFAPQAIIETLNSHLSGSRPAGEDGARPGHD